MRGVLCHAFEGIKALTIGEAEEPRPRADEVLVDVHAASVSYADYLMICGNAHEGPPFAAWYLLGSIFDNPNAVCLTPSYVENVMGIAGFNVERTEIMLPGITMLTTASKGSKA